MKFRDKSTTVLVFTAFVLSFIVLWNVSDLIAKIENQKRGMGTYKNVRTVNICFGKASELVENGEYETAVDYSQKTIEGLLGWIDELPECNISVTSMYFLVRHKQSNINAEIIFKRNEGLPYEVDEIYDKSGQILIGESLKKYFTEDAGKSIFLSNESYSIKGILKNYGMSRQDERVIMLYENFSLQQKYNLIRQMAEDYSRYNYDTGITLCLGSSNAGSPDNSYTLLTDYLNEIDGTDVTSVPARGHLGEQNYWYQLYHSIFGSISVIFAVINGVVVSNLWYQRRRREFLIRRIFGYSNRKLWLLMWKEMGKIAVCSLICSTLIWTIYVFAKGSKIQWNLIGLQCLVMAGATVLVIFVTTICPYIKTMRLEPAEGLNRDMVLENKLNFILSVILTGIGFFLIGFTFLVYLAGSYGKESAENVLVQGIGHTGVINFRDTIDFASENGREFRKSAFESEVIHSIGNIEYMEFEGKDFSELYRIQNNNNLKKGISDDGGLRVLSADLEVFNIAGLSLEDGVAVQNLEYSDNQTIYLYLGYAYRNIPVGTRFVTGMDDEERTVYEVAGIIQKGERFVSTDLLYEIDFTTIRNDVNTDYEIICLNNGYSRSSPWLFSVDKKFSMDEGMNELEKMAARYGIDMEDYPLQEMFDVVETETAIMQESLLDMLFCLVIVILVVVTTLQIVQIYHYSHQYGILYAIGFTTADMQRMIILRNVIYFILSVCLGVLLLLLSGQKYFITNIQVKELFFQILSYKVIPIDMVLMMFLFFVVSFIPCRMFHRMDPVSMIQGR